MRGVNYIGAVFDSSGYGEAARNYVLSLHKAGVPVTVTAMSFDVNPPEVGTDAERKTLRSLVNKKIDFDFVIVHLTPDHVPQFRKKYPGKYLISCMAWETSKLHPDWVGYCNQADEVWVPSEYNVQALKNSGVTVPVTCIQHGIAPDSFDNVTETFELEGVDRSKTYIFYSIFQWNARKNPDTLLRAYYNAFTADDPVRLVLKTYIGGGLKPEQEAASIKGAIQKIKKDMGLSSFPKVSLVTQHLTTQQLKALHKYGDCYVAFPHAEGFGLCFMEAGLAGKAVIAPRHGGQLEFLADYNSYLVDCQEDYLRGMGNFNQWYLGDQTWAYINTIDAACKLREIFDNKVAAGRMGEVLRDWVKEWFSWEEVSDQMIDRLKEI